jgi:hypothetical protein
MTAAAGKDRYWLDWTADGQELAEASRAVQQPNLISSLPEITNTNVLGY